MPDTLTSTGCLLVCCMLVIIPIIEDARHPHKYRMLVGTLSVSQLPSFFAGNPVQSGNCCMFPFELMLDENLVCCNIVLYFSFCLNGGSVTMLLVLFSCD